MKKLLLALSLILPCALFAQTVVTIGTGTENTLYGPVYIFDSTSTNTHSWNLSVYDAADIQSAGGFAGNITKISWNKSDAGAYLDNDATFEIHLKHTATTGFTTGADYNVEVMGATMVFSTTTQGLPAAPGWIDFPLTTPFTWNGTDNIMVLTRWVRQGNGTASVNWMSTTTTPSKVSHSFNTSSTMGSLYTNPKRPNIRFEFTSLLGDDAGVVSVDSVRGRCSGTHPVYATIRNFGNNPINSVDVNWTVDGVSQTPVNSTTSIAPGTTYQVLLGNITLASGVVNTVMAWTSSPNGVADSNAVNDTTTAANVTAAMSGTYTIGPAGDFQTFAAAFTALENAGICQDVQVNVEPGVYNEKVSLNSVPGSNDHQLVFSSSGNDSTSVTLTTPSFPAATDNYTLRLNGVHNVTFNAMTFERSGGSSYSTVVELAGGSSGITFTSNRFAGPPGMTVTNTDGTRSGIFCDGVTAWNNLTVRGNLFQDNANGIWVNGAQSAYSQGVVIEDNVFNTFYVGVFLLYENGAVISGNTVTRNNPSATVDFFAISVRYGSGALMISKNNMSTSAGNYGIRLRDCIQPGGQSAEISNNFVHVNASGTGRGISIEDGCNNVRILHNSVNYQGTNATTGRALFIDGTGTLNITILNNIFSNSGGGYASYVTSAGASGVTVSNNNCYYSTGSSLAYWTSAVSNLAALQSASSMEANSLSGDPLFVSATDLHINAGFLGDAGSSMAQVADDIDGDVRNIMNPDIGADEFTPVSVTEIENDLFSVYPNPATYYLVVRLKKNITGSLYLLDIAGRIVKQEWMTNAENVFLNTSGLTGGIYTLLVDDGGLIRSAKVSVIQ